MEHLERLLGVSRRPHLVALAGEQHAGELQVDRVVVDDQDRFTGHGGYRERALPPGGPT